MNKRSLAMLFTLALIIPAGRRGSAADAPDDDGEYTVVSVKRKLPQVKQKLEQARKARVEAQAALRSLPSLEPETVQAATQRFQQAREAESEIASVADGADALIQRIEAASDPDEKRGLLRQADGLLNAGMYLGSSHQLNTAFLEPLKRVAEISRSAVGQGEDVGRTLAGFAFNQDELGGGVFLDEPARLDVERAKITRAEFDEGEGRFVLFEGARKIPLPPMDADLAATAIKCLYGGGSRNLVATSFNIDPVNMGRKLGTLMDDVMLGCDALPGTELGRILIDSDDLVSWLWTGKNREGEDLTRAYGYHSMSQMMLDHPMMQVLADDVPLADRQIEMRNWIRPEKIHARRAGGGLEFDPVVFRFLSETANISDPKFFRGTSVPNPGADAFAAYFTKNFEKFAHLELREDEHTRRKIRPFEELREAAKVVGVILWIRGGNGRAEIPMDTAWAFGRRVAEVFTEASLPRIKLQDVEKEIVPPIVIYGRYGPSRIVDKRGRMIKIKYDDEGRFVKMVGARRAADGKIEETSDTVLANAARRGD